MNKLTGFLEKSIHYILRKIASYIIITNRKKIILVQESFSGSNTYALSKFFSKKFREIHEVKIFKDSKSKSFFEAFKKYLFLSSARIIITTHESYKFKKNQIHFQLWHGALIKKNEVMIENVSGKFVIPRSWQKSDFILSYSETYSTFMNACMVTESKKYKILGAPRNDFLMRYCNEDQFNKIINHNKFEKKIIIVPTMRFERQESNAIDNTSEDDFKFYKIFLENNELHKKLLESNTLMVFKPHPHDEKIIYSKYRHLSNNVFILTDDYLEDKGIDLYEFLNSFDLLITDYSSVFYDFLLLNKPIFFYHQDEEIKLDQRGFLVESLEDFLPGTVFRDKKVLISKLNEFIDNNFEDKYFLHRKKLLNIMHKYKDGFSSKRIEKFIEEII